MAAYSFMDVGAAIDGPGGNIDLGKDAGHADEGISIEPSEDRNTMTTGAGGEVMHSLHASNAGTVRVRLLKTSPTNARLMEMFKFQKLSGANWGRNVIVVRDHARGDIGSCRQVAFAGHPPLSWGKVGNIHEWVFHAGHVDPTLGEGVPAAVGVA